MPPDFMIPCLPLQRVTTNPQNIHPLTVAESIYNICRKSRNPHKNQNHEIRKNIEAIFAQDRSPWRLIMIAQYACLYVQMATRGCVDTCFIANAFCGS